jgi:NitT/TauT family transport system ATP-binding protein
MSPDKDVLHLEAVNKVFVNPRTRTSSQALSDITLTIERGEWVSLLGPSGSGKTTLLNIMAGLESATSGTVLHEGAAVTSPSADRGMLFQEYALFPWKTVIGNVEFGLRYGPKGAGVSSAERRHRTEGILKLVGLSGAEHKYPHELSGGMKQRCALARLLVCDPDVLLMDEPLAAVDAQTRAILQEELLRVWGETSLDRKTVVYVTHSIEEAIFLSDRVVVLSRNPGRVKEVMRIELTRPRLRELRTELEFQQLVQQAWDLVRDEAYQATLELGAPEQGEEDEH